MPSNINEVLNQALQRYNQSLDESQAFQSNIEAARMGIPLQNNVSPMTQDTSKDNAQLFREALNSPIVSNKPSSMEATSISDAWRENGLAGVLGHGVYNVGKDFMRIGTGLTYAGKHPLKTLAGAGQAAYDYYAGLADKPWYVRAAYGLTDTPTLLTSSFLKGSDIRDMFTGKINPLELVGRVGNNIYENPVGTTLDVWGLKALKGGSKVASAGEKAEGAIDIAKAQVSKDIQATRDSAAKIDKAIRKGKYSEADLEEVIQAHRVGSELPSRLKPLAKEWGVLQDSYDRAWIQSNKYGQTLTKADKRAIADAQAALDAELKAGGERSFQEVLKERVPYQELLDAESTVLADGTKVTGKEALEQLAKEGDDLARTTLENAKNFDKGYLRIIPQSGIKEIQKIGEIVEKDRVFAGKASSRAYGTATNQQVVDNIVKNFDQWTDLQMGSFTKQVLVDELKSGSLGGRALVDETTKDVSYISKSALENGDLANTINTATKEATQLGKDAIAIDTKILNALKEQISMVDSGSPFGKGLLNDFYQTSKGIALSSGSYLTGNAITGITNAMINEGINPVNWVKDIAATAVTKGNLTKNLGLYRNAARMSRKVDNPVMKFLAKVNEPVSSAWSYVDAKMQNTFAEIAANNKLRKAGIPVSERAKYLEEMGKMELANTINDVRRVALINGTKTVLPRAVNKVFAVANPFWRWIDTAAQSSAYMMNKNPLLANYVTVQGLSSIGYDKEMQNRLNLRASLDKPFVTYKLDNRTNQLRETSFEFVPQMNTIKFAGNTAAYLATGKSKYLEGVSGQTIPLLSAMGGAFKGLDKYGKPLRSHNTDKAWYENQAIAIQGGKRYMYDRNSGQFTEVGGRGDEVLSVAAKELLVYPTLFNKTIAPLAAAGYSALTGNQVDYFQPYSGSLLGQFGTGGSPEMRDANAAIAGDPTKPSSIDVWTGSYSTPYYEDSDTMRGNQMKKMLYGQAYRRKNIGQMQQLLRGGLQ